MAPSWHPPPHRNESRQVWGLSLLLTCCWRTADPPVKVTLLTSVRRRTSAATGAKWPLDFQRNQEKRTRWKSRTLWIIQWWSLSVFSTVDERLWSKRKVADTIVADSQRWCLFSVLRGRVWFDPAHLCEAGTDYTTKTSETLGGTFEVGWVWHQHSNII